ncbi:MAG: acetyl-CoA carboxylase carboxyltransferase subunit alpha [Bacilli bacterium]|nr:acetyl-CoA carboxylase carboxyltransferase subunit alpha [Bacilli bacterium]MDD4077813.1 acetyl-CoA carboxylase carboxyltransferase subunit alpha [Bacilli bacterium]
MTKTTVDKVWEIVQIARNIKRPTAQVLIKYLIDDFIELHGDRLYADDSCFIGGIGLLNNMPISVIGQEKGLSTNEKIKRNFGMGHPEGYHKALRLMRQAEKFNRPILFVIDTPGAYPGIGAEERGQAMAIAVNLAEMISLKVPMISVVLGEGGSGGALGIGVSDEVWMFENATYSILSPEGFASILYKDASLARQAASDMKITAQDLYRYKIIDRIIPEAKDGLHNDPEYSFNILKNELIEKYYELRQKNIADILALRYKKYRNIGIYEES